MKGSILFTKIVSVLAAFFILFTSYGSAQELPELSLAESGPYEVGLMSLNFIDSNRNDQLVNVVLWFPSILTDELRNANTDYTGSNARYFPDDILINQYDLLPGPATLIMSTGIIKDEPSRRSTTLSEVESGTIVNIIAVDGDWVQIEDGDIVGWGHVNDYVNIREVDSSQAPYPLIIYTSEGRQGNAWRSAGLMQHLASHGFVVATMHHACDPEVTCTIDRSLDMLFALDQLAMLNEGPLQGMIDGDNVGIAGFSMGGFTALSLAGARIDVDFFLDFPDSSSIDRALGDGTEFSEFDATVAAMSDYMAEFYDLEEGELFPSMGDDRIQAVFAIAPWLSSLYGPSGLDTTNKPTLLFVNRYDQFIVYENETVPIYAGWEGENRNIISFLNHDHFAQESSAASAYYKHLSTAWFGYYLQGHENYLPLMSADFVNSFSDIAWGLVESD